MCFLRKTALSEELNNQSWERAAADISLLQLSVSNLRRSRSVTDHSHTPELWTKSIYDESVISKSAPWWQTIKPADAQLRADIPRRERGVKKHLLANRGDKHEAWHFITLYLHSLPSPLLTPPLPPQPTPSTNSGLVCSCARSVKEALVALKRVPFMLSLCEIIVPAVSCQSRSGLPAAQ